MSRASLQFWMLGSQTLLTLVCALYSPVIADEVPRAIAAASNSGNPPPPPIQYRRIFVPADKMDAWPRDG
jgi:hypothetical protein